MWTVNAEEGMRCNECLHEIAEGSICLSQIPPVVPEGFHRRNYQNFCIACEGCNSNVEELREDTPPCFALWLDHWYTSREQAPATVDCGYCGAAINRGTITVAQEFFDWPPPEVDLNSERGGASASGSPAGVAIAGTGIPRPAGGWENLSRATQRRFKVGGLGRDLGSRSEAMAQRLYDSVPKEVRNLGEEAVKRFLKGKDASHIRSVSNAPGRARQPGNVVWEKSSLNRARGGRNMIPTEVAKAKSAGRLSGLSTVGRSMASNAAKGGAIAALTEAPVSGVENFLHWKRGRKSGQQAVKDAAKDVTLAGAVGATTAGVMTGCVRDGSWTLPGTVRSSSDDRRGDDTRRQRHIAHCQGCSTRPATRRIPSFLLQRQRLQAVVRTDRHRRWHEARFSERAHHPRGNCPGAGSVWCYCRRRCRGPARYFRFIVVH